MRQTPVTAGLAQPWWRTVFLSAEEKRVRTCRNAPSCLFPFQFILYRGFQPHFLQRAFLSVPLPLKNTQWSLPVYCVKCERGIPHVRHVQRYFSAPTLGRVPLLQPLSRLCIFEHISVEHIGLGYQQWGQCWQPRTVWKDIKTSFSRVKHAKGSDQLAFCVCAGARAAASFPEAFSSLSGFAAQLPQWSTFQFISLLFFASCFLDFMSSSYLDSSLL